MGHGHRDGETVALMDKEFQLATLYLSDCQRLIAAFRAQRWDVVKRGAAINVGLAAASLSYTNSFWPRVALLFFSILVSSASWYLVKHYTRRLVRTRDRGTNIDAWLTEHGADYRPITKDDPQQPTYSEGGHYDREEQRMFATILACSTIPGFTATILGFAI
jgi:hypothetical protein